jgi:hypothetical protein
MDIVVVGGVIVMFSKC